VAVRAHGRDRVLEVVKVLDKRVGAPAATECVIDRTPAPPEDEERVPDRDRGTGRPTKRDRRRLDRLRR